MERYRPKINTLGERRKIIDFYTSRPKIVRWNLVTLMNGIRIVELAEHRYLQDCYDYVLRPDHPMDSFEEGGLIRNIMDGRVKETSKPVVGDIVCYWNRDGSSTEDIPSHLGRYWGNGRVRSKWGLFGHVYEHPTLLVPSDYGNEVKIFPNPKRKLYKRVNLAY